MRDGSLEQSSSRIVKKALTVNCLGGIEELGRYRKNFIPASCFGMVGRTSLTNPNPSKSTPKIGAGADYVCADHAAAPHSG